MFEARILQSQAISGFMKKIRISRRQLWMGSFVVLGAAVICALVIWVRNDMPLPPSLMMRKFDPKQPWAVLFDLRREFLFENFYQRTSKLDLRGTRWSDSLSGAELEFGSDGRLRWITRPVDKFAGHPKYAKYNRSYIDRLENAEFDLDKGGSPVTIDVGEVTIGDNLQIAGFPRNDNYYTGVGMGRKKLAFFIFREGEKSLFLTFDRRSESNSTDSEE